jgi:hypothetical protein
MLSSRTPVRDPAPFRRRQPHCADWQPIMRGCRISKASTSYAQRMRKEAPNRSAPCSMAKNLDRQSSRFSAAACASLFNPTRTQTTESSSRSVDNESNASSVISSSRVCENSPSSFDNAQDGRLSAEVQRTPKPLGVSVSNHERAFYTVWRSEKSFLISNQVVAWIERSGIQEPRIRPSFIRATAVPVS